MSDGSGGALLGALDGEAGFYDRLRLEPEERRRLLERVEEQWMERIVALAPEHLSTFRRLGIARYHEASKLIDHATAWPKRERIVSPDTVSVLRGTGLFAALERELGAFSISGEDGVREEEVYWRLVRPFAPSDVGPLHADAWFWDLGHGVTPAGVRRVKVWIALVCEVGLNGLLIVPGSHARQWAYSGVARDGKSKPVMAPAQHVPTPSLVPTAPGAAVVFHDSLLHGGAPNRGTETRVSLEFTAFVSR